MLPMGIPYVGPYGYAGYAPYSPVVLPAGIPAPVQAELKVETIEAPKAVGYAVVTPYAPAAVPAPYAAAPYAAPYAHGYFAAPIVPASSQFHAQDEFGNLKFGYSNINSAKSEAGNTYGGVSGGYQYVDANGVLQTVSYVADGLGFRTVDSRLPAAPLVQAPAPVFEGTQIPDTPEVAEAKAEFQKAYDAAVESA
ncbi:Cuticle protein 6 [Caligus rogercresseyi]|uniref:Cuticle protein 6 n=1 Tax=Caligus rogercresseyi TaxID=217165 RepID=A0A7T8HIS0_CALRO|nr:Cuticle protein 6 [Caligus rogercresseyi]